MSEGLPYLQFDYRVFEKIYTLGLTGQEHDVFWYVYRKTVGWEKKEEHVHNVDIAKATGHHKKRISQVISSLASKKIIATRLEGDDYHKDRYVRINNPDVWEAGERMPEDNDVQVVFDTWNEHADEKRLRPKHTGITVDMRREIKKALRIWSVEAITNAINNYAVTGDEWWSKYRLTGKTSLAAFLKKGRVDEFKELVVEARTDPRGLPIIDEEPTPERHIKWSVVPPEGTVTPERKKWWRNILVEIKKKHGDQVFNTWIRPTRLVAINNGAIWIAVPNCHYYDFLISDLYDDFKTYLIENDMPKDIRIHIATAPDLYDDIF